MRLLIVDQSGTYANSLISQGREAGFSVAAQRVDSPEALRLALAAHDWDAVVAGSPIPDLSPDDILGVVREVKPQLPVMFLPEKPGMIALARMIEPPPAECPSAPGKSNGRHGVFHEILDAIPQSVFWKDLDSVYLGCNLAFARAVGIDNPEDIVGKTDYDLPWPTDEADAYRAADREVMESGSAKRYIIEPLQQADGACLWIQTTKLPLTGENGRICGVIGVYEDITERKRAAEALRDSEERLKTLVDSAPYGAHTYELHPDGRLVFTGSNASANRILGVDHRQFIGKTIEEAFPALVFTEIPDAYRRVAAEGGLFDEDQVGYDENGITGAYEIRAFQTGSNRMAVFFRDITERKRAEEALAESERMLRDLAENVPGVVFQFYVRKDGTKGFHYLSPRAPELFNLRPDWQLGANIHPQDRDRFLRSVDEAIETVSPWCFEGRFIAPSGEVRWGQGASHPIKRGDEIIFNGVLLDITDRKRTEEALRSSEETYRLLFENSADMIWILKGPVFIEVNSAVARTLGYSSPSEVIGLTPWDISPERQPDGSGSREKAESYIAAALEKGPQAFEWVHKKKDGTPVYCQISLAACKIGDELRVQAIGRDITEHKLADRTLRESELKFRTIVDFTYDWEYWVSPKGDIIYMSPSCERITGYSVGEFVDNPDLLTTIVHPDDQSLVDHHLHLLDAGEPHFHDFRIITRTGEIRWIAHGCQAVFGDDGKWLGRRGSNRDITERKRVEEALRLDELRLEALLNLGQMTQASSRELTEFAMEEGVRLTGSKLGYVAFVSEDQKTLSMHAWSRNAMTERETEQQPLDYPLESTGLWGEAVRRRKPVVINDCAVSGPCERGFPGVHIPLTRHMSVPIFDGNRVVVVAGVSNKETDYNESDVRQLTLLMGGMWRIIRRNQVEEQVRRSNRTLRVLSGVNEALIRAADELELLQDVCRIIVEVGGYRMAWIGFPEEDARKSIRPVAYAGHEAGYLSMMKFSWADSELGHGPAGTAIRTGKPAVCRHMLTDPAFAPWREEATKRGYQSLISIPLITEGRTLGDINIYSDMPGIFEAEEVGLLTELAGDLSYGISALRMREEYRRAAEALGKSELKYRKLYESMIDGFVIVDMDGNILEFNQPYVAMLGYSEDELRAMTYRDITPQDWWDYEDKIVENEVLERGYSGTYEKEYRRKDGTVFPVELRTNLIRDENGNPSGMWAIVRDITQRKRTEDEKRQFYRETIRSVTDGKLEISHRSELHPYEEHSDFARAFRDPHELSSARQEVQTYCESKGLAGDALGLFITAIGEAMNNALKHAGGGRVFCGSGHRDLWVGVADTGPGIATLTLPSATLRRGYSTKVSMGMGYSIMLDVADRVMLNTGPEGTIVIVFKSLRQASPAISLADLPDTWETVPNI